MVLPEYDWCCSHFPTPSSDRERLMNRGIIGTIIGVLVIVILVIVILQMT